MSVSGWSARVKAGCFYGLLVAVVLALYGPSVRFGLIWDDPRYYQTVAAQASVWKILSSPQPPTYQFYRPAAVLYGRLFVSPEGVVNVPLANVLHIGMHLCVALALVPILQALGLRALHARLTALLFTVFPLSYQAVAWQQNQQPLMLMWVAAALVFAIWFCRRRAYIWLALSGLAYAVALLVQEGAAPFAVFFFWLAARQGQLKRGRVARWPMVHAGLAAAYALVWLTMPRHGNVTGLGFQSPVLAYILQGVVFPVSSGLASVLTHWPLPALIALFAALAGVLTLGVWRWTSARAVALSWVWLVLGALPIWAGLSWAYVELGPRLLYPASVGIAGLWAGWGVWAFSREQPTWRRALGGLIYLLALALSLQQWWRLQNIYQAGTQQLARAVDVLSASPASRVLFVNFPDRIELKPRPYPLGFWGVTLAPVVQNLSDYALAQTGRSGQDQSASAFLTGADERDRWPYRVDMRGENWPPEKLYQAALEADAVYLTRYHADGTLDLQFVGNVRPAQPARELAAFGEAARLADAGVDLSASRALTIRLVWDCLKPLREHDTPFVHVWQADKVVGDADGDSLGGLIALAVWKPGTQIVDVRRADLARLAPGRYEVRVGIYNRLDNTRYTARGPDGQRFADDEAPAATFEIK